MPPVSYGKTSTAYREVNTPDDLLATVKWFHDLLPATAKAELDDAQAVGSLLEPVTYVDGRKNKNVEAVNFFGTIAYVESGGPLAEAIAAAQAFVQSIAPNRTGFYRGALQWFANGQATMGAPNVERVGLGGNVQLVDLAPYASWLEIEYPRGIIYGAFTFLARMFGRRLSIAYGYANPNDYGGLMERPDNPARVPYAIPVLTMGNPGSSVRDGARARPGVHGQRVRAEERRAAGAANRNSGGRG